MCIFRQLAAHANHESGQGFKSSLELNPFLQDDARLRLQQFAANAVTSGYLSLAGETSLPGRQTLKQAFTIDNIIGTDSKHPCARHQTALPMSPLPGFASQFGSHHCLSVPHNFMMSYRGIRPADPELLSTLTSAYGHMNGNYSPVEYYNSIKCLQQSSPPSLPFPIKPTALSALPVSHSQGPALKIPRSSDVRDADKMVPETAKTKPLIGHSVDALLRPSKEQEALSIRPSESDTVLDNVIEQVKVGR